MKQSKEKIKNSKAITLISLAITIIVLIILAGVTISLTIGENGIITRAKEAKNLYINAQEEEQIRINALEKEMNSISEDIKIEEIMLNKNETEILAENTETLIATIKPSNASNKKITWASSDSEVATVDDYGKITAKKEGTIVITAKTNDGSNKQATCTVTVRKTLSAQITSANYGDKVNYNANGITDWKIFYKEGNDIFIIMSDYLEASKLPTTCGVTLDATRLYMARWINAPTLDQNWESNRTLFQATKYTLKEKSNSKCVSTLLNTANWSSFVNESYADLAIGTPTFEMWCASWNAKGNSTITPTANENDLGYKMNGYGLSDQYYISNKLDMSNDLYFPHKEIYNKSYGYWLASPAAQTESAILSIDYRNSIGVNGYDNQNYSARPLVHLKTTVTATQDSNGVWQLK